MMISNPSVMIGDPILRIEGETAPIRLHLRLMDYDDNNFFLDAHGYSFYIPIHKKNIKTEGKILERKDKMTEMKTAKYIRTGVTRPSNHPEVTEPILIMNSDENYGDMGFTMYWEPVTQPFVMNPDNHKHPFPQYLCFLGSNPKNLLDLGAEIELTLSEDGVHMEKHIITTASTVYIPSGLYHCPLIFTRVDRPMIFIDLFFARAYQKKSSQS